MIQERAKNGNFQGGNEMSKQDVPIGGQVNINGKVYECSCIKRGSRSFDCTGCDLYDNDGCHDVSCIGDFRKDGQWVIYKEVKQ